MSVITALRYSTARTAAIEQTPETRGLMGTLVLYRYISWLITSAFYLAEPGPSVAMSFKIGVVIALLLASYITVRSYHGIEDRSPGRRILIALEALGLAFLLIPTGGLRSPFIWYALNPIFLAARESAPYYCWVVLAGFLAAASYGTTAFEADDLLSVMAGQRGVVLVYLLLTVAARLMTQLVRRLEDAYASSQRLVEHISSLYQALEACSAGEDLTGLARVLATFSAKLTSSELGICYLALGHQEAIMEVHNPNNLISLDEAKRALGLALQRLSIDQEDHVVEQGFLFVAVRSPSLHYGLIGFKQNRTNKCPEVSRSIRFLSELAAISVERWQADQLSTRLKVVEEQNRIANEIHDGVSQHLFGMVCALHSLIKTPDCGPVRTQLDTLLRTARTALTELRTCIYGISPSKRGEQPFIQTVRSYLDNVVKLNGVRIHLDVEGSEDAVSPAVRQALYRVIKEATGNSIRHGRCQSIVISLEMHPDRVRMVVKDDGIGFDPSYVQNQGLGLSNMSGLMAALGGECRITSRMGIGTVVVCCIPKGLVEGVRA